MAISFKKPLGTFRAKSLDDAYLKGFFSGGMSRQRFLEILRKRNKNKNLYFRTNGDYAALFSNNDFICGFANTTTIPRYTIQQWDDSLGRLTFTDGREENIDPEDSAQGRILVRGWEPAARIIKGKGYEVRATDF